MEQAGKLYKACLFVITDVIVNESQLIWKT